MNSNRVNGLVSMGITAYAVGFPDNRYPDWWPQPQPIFYPYPATPATEVHIHVPPPVLVGDPLKDNEARLVTVKAARAELERQLERVKAAEEALEAGVAAMRKAQKKGKS